VLIDIDLVSRTGGLRVLLQALADGPHELAPAIVTAFLYLVDAPRTRSYLHPGSDLEVGRLPLNLIQYYNFPLDCFIRFHGRLWKRIIP